MRGWRKWSIAFGALVMGFVLALLEKLTGDFALIASITVGAYSAGNAAVHFSQREPMDRTKEAV